MRPATAFTTGAIIGTTLFWTAALLTTSAIYALEPDETRR